MDATVLVNRRGSGKVRHSDSPFPYPLLSCNKAEGNEVSAASWECVSPAPAFREIERQGHRHGRGLLMT